MVECGVFFRVVFLAAVVKNGGGDGKRIVGGFFGRAGHVEQVEREAHYGLGVADEAAGAEGYLRVIFAGGGGGHGPKAIRRGEKYSGGQLAYGGIGYQF